MSDAAAATRSPETQVSWHVLRVATGCEEMVTEWLRVYLKATVRFFKLRESKRTKVRNTNEYTVSHIDRPLFPGYLFVRSDQLHKLEQNGKILGPIRTGQDFAVIRDADLEAVAKGCSDKDIFLPNVESKTVALGGVYSFLPGSIFGAAVVNIVKVLNNGVVEANVIDTKSGTKRLVTVSAKTISTALMEA